MLQIQYYLYTIEILIIHLQNNTVTSFSSLVHMCHKIHSKKMENAFIRETLPPEMVENILKLLNCKDICKAQLVCRRWKEIIDLSNLLKRAEGKTLNRFITL